MADEATEAEVIFRARATELLGGSSPAWFADDFSPYVDRGAATLAEAGVQPTDSKMQEALTNLETFVVRIESYSSDLDEGAFSDAVEKVASSLCPIWPFC